MEKQTKESIAQQFKLHENDTGSTRVQIAMLTHRIKELAAHLKENKKDYSTGRGLIRLVNQRRGFLRYLGKKNPGIYTETIKALGIRK